MLGITTLNPAENEPKFTRPSWFGILNPEVTIA